MGQLLRVLCVPPCLPRALHASCLPSPPPALSASARVPHPPLLRSTARLFPLQGMELLAKEGYEFVAVFDADFKPEPSFLEKTVPYLVGNPEARWG